MNREEAEKILTHGEWFYAEAFDSKYRIIFKHDRFIVGEWLHVIRFTKCVALVGTIGEYYEESGSMRIYIKDMRELRPATKEEILKYFPDEFLPEPKKRPITRNKKQYILR